MSYSKNAKENKKSKKKMDKLYKSSKDSYNVKYTTDTDNAKAIKIYFDDNLSTTEPNHFERVTITGNGTVQGRILLTGIGTDKTIDYSEARLNELISIEFSISSDTGESRELNSITITTTDLKNGNDSVKLLTFKLKLMLGDNELKNELKTVEFKVTNA